MAPNFTVYRLCSWLKSSLIFWLLEDSDWIYHMSAKLKISDFAVSIPAMAHYVMGISCKKNPVSFQSKHGLAYSLNETGVGRVSGKGKGLWAKSKKDTKVQRENKIMWD